jgi:hypothetical protein
MNLIIDLVNELKIIHPIFYPNIIKEINDFVLNKLLIIIDIFKQNNNKYNLLSILVKFGFQLENLINNNNNNNKLYNILYVEILILILIKILLLKILELILKF